MSDRDDGLAIRTSEPETARGSDAVVRAPPENAEVLSVRVTT